MKFRWRFKTQAVEDTQKVTRCRRDSDSSQGSNGKPSVPLSVSAPELPQLRAASPLVSDGEDVDYWVADSPVASHRLLHIAHAQGRKGVSSFLKEVGTPRTTGRVVSEALMDSQSKRLAKLVRETSAPYTLPTSFDFRIADGGVGYYRQKNRSECQGTYIVITGADPRGAGKNLNFIKLAVSRKFDILAIDGRHGRDLSLGFISLILRRIRTKHKDIVLKGIYLGLHGSINNPEGVHKLLFTYENRIQTSALVTEIIKALDHTQDPLSVMSCSCYGGHAMQGVRSALPAGSRIYFTASADEVGEGMKLAIHDTERIAIEDFYLFSYLLRHDTSSIPHHSIVGQPDFGNFRSIAILLLSQKPQFTTAIKEDIISTLSTFISRECIKAVLDILLENPEGFQRWHRDKFIDIGDDRVNAYSIALAIMYYTYTRHFRDISLDLQRASFVLPQTQKSLFTMVARGKIEQIQAILDAGRDINIQNIQGETILMHAVWRENEQVIKLLLSYKEQIDLSLRDECDATVFTYAVTRLTPSIMREFPAVTFDDDALLKFKKHLISIIKHYDKSLGGRKCLETAVNLLALDGITISFVYYFFKYMKRLDLSFFADIVTAIEEPELQISVLEAIRFIRFSQSGKDIIPFMSTFTTDVPVGSQQDLAKRVEIAKQLDMQDLMSLSWSSTKDPVEFREKLTVLLSLYAQFDVRKSTEQTLPGGFQFEPKQIYRAIENSLRGKEMRELRAIFLKREEIVGRCHLTGSHVIKLSSGLAQLIYQQYSQIPIIPEQTFSSEIGKLFNTRTLLEAAAM